jgi:hypothetical protein
MAAHLLMLGKPIAPPWPWNGIHHRDLNSLLRACSWEQCLPLQQGYGMNAI